jgi:hypothetical protein
MADRDGQVFAETFERYGLPPATPAEAAGRLERRRAWFCDLPVKEIDVEREAPRRLAAPPGQAMSPTSRA